VSKPPRARRGGQHLRELVEHPGPGDHLHEVSPPAVRTDPGEQQAGKGKLAAHGWSKRKPGHRGNSFSGIPCGYQQPGTGHWRRRGKFMPPAAEKTLKQPPSEYVESA
jgi:hypothetical protein